MTIYCLRLPAFAAVMLAAASAASAQSATPSASQKAAPPAAQSATPPASQSATPSASTTGLAPADRPSNNDQPSLAGQVVPSPQDAAAHSRDVFARDQRPTLAHTFNFTDEQKQRIRDALAPERGEAANVTVAEGTELPRPLAVQPMPDALAQQMPWVKPYNYVKLGNKIAIVDPHLPVVVAIIE